jgi:hypothetical protein
MCLQLENCQGVLQLLTWERSNSFRFSPIEYEIQITQKLPHNLEVNHQVPHKQWFQTLVPNSLDIEHEKHKWLLISKRQQKREIIKNRWRHFNQKSLRPLHKSSAAVPQRVTPIVTKIVNGKLILLQGANKQQQMSSKIEKQKHISAKLLDGISHVLCKQTLHKFPYQFLVKL